MQSEKTCSYKINQNEENMVYTSMLLLNLMKCVFQSVGVN